ncbi:MAG: cytochrome c biogenesis protein CcdA [Eubacteriaceae bacterium]|nr:cytochrome c biogenesis protein CcdA [Eubacteriaceae bacterium]
MQYFAAFLEGIITFISPCLLPMLPVYVSYFAGGDMRNTKKTFICASGFVSGFTLVFTLLGALAGSLGSFVIKYKTALQIICGLIVIALGLNHLGLFKLNIFDPSPRKANVKNLGFFSSALFGIVFSLGWTPCVGAFLGSALMMASLQGHIFKGMAMLLCYCAGLGLPFMLSALLIDRLKGTTDFIKKNYGIINTISGCLLVVLGILMACGVMGQTVGRVL